MKFRTAGIGALTLATTVAAVTAAAALEQHPLTRSDSSSHSSFHAPSALVLTVNNGASASASAPQRAVTLTCGSYTPGGTHPQPAAACDALQQADGRLSGLRDSGRSCTLDLRPVTVTLQGAWQGRRVNEERSFPNDCVKGAFGPLTEF
ncbi:subtilase-type protease inhibitor [Streptomyces sp. LP05-1]|uniref:Subtilase-type protease inhibitor n=1 Tax=Streptomyces pyxinae TaxID=2970734 RepID=A0ABT2CL63_9ACTN|nr:subtilase-type protease inhibitor [Streptomyces sp. LP05-1]MCS0637441.1 subtilase-type protease inhibitor [Streptomyces sp. LP05-1]